MAANARVATSPVALALSICLLAGAGARADERARDADDPRTAAPRFELRPSDGGALPSLDALPLKATAAHVEVAGPIAHVTLEQTWANEGAEPITASYVFPAGTRAAVVGMRMTLGERTIVADIAERKEARERFEAARDEGRTASLLEQQRPNVLAVEVANILPGDVVEVVLEYTELLVPVAGAWELVLPQVVGPRYGSEPADSSAPSSSQDERWLSRTTLAAGDVPWRWSVDVRLSSALPLREVSSPSHGLDPTAYEGRHVDLAFEQGPRDVGGDRDFVLRWRLAGDEVETGVLLFRDPRGEDFFAAAIEPPARVTRASMPPREIVFVVDVSGSMGGFPLDTARTVARELLQGMRPRDRFNVLFFSGDSALLSPESLPVTRANVARAERMLERISAGGGTNLDDALARALALPTDTAAFSRSVVVITDGYVGFEKTVFRTIRERLGQANLFAFGVGSSVNRYLVEGMAKAGLAEPFVALNEDEARQEARRLVELLARPALTDVQVSFEGFDAYDVEPRATPDLFAGRPIVVFGKYRGGATGRVRVSGLAGSARVERVVEISDHLERPAHRALRSLWARHRVASLVDFSDEEDRDVAEVTRLGLAHSLLTPYTSFVAVDSLARDDGRPVVVEQPSALPAGMGGEGGGFGALTMSGTGRGGGGLGVGLSSAVGGLRGAAFGSGGGGIDLGARGKGTTRIRPGKVVVHGSFSRDAVERVVRRSLNQVRYCYEKALARSPELAGRIVIEMEVGGHGTVKRALVVASTFPDETVGECVRRVAERWRFPAPPDGGSRTVRYPFVFSPS